jgi:hypothetical protein
MNLQERDAHDCMVEHLTLTEIREHSKECSLCAKLLAMAERLR